MVLAVSFDEATEVESTKYHHEEKAIHSTNNIGLPSVLAMSSDELWN